MRLNPVPAKTGAQWVRQGIQTFFRQPLALSGLFLMFIMAITLVSWVPLIGHALALALLPAATLGLMVATREADQGTFPMPSVLASAFRSGQARLRAMLVLGALYALGFLAILGLSALIDGGQFAQLYLGEGDVSPEVVVNADFQTAMWVGMVLYLPLALLFWHAPALVHWHGIPPVKSLFFSFWACWQNKAAMTVFMLAWMAVFTGVGFAVAIIGLLLSSTSLSGSLLFATTLVLAAMFFTSFYFCFRDSFLSDSNELI